MRVNKSLSEQDRQELHQFRRWVKALSPEELLQAMQFSLQQGQDYDLLKEMVRQESPPPTPVHPRAMGYRPRMSAKGAQLDFPHWERILKRTKPRLFQFTERQSMRSRGKQREQQFDVIARRKIAPWGEVYSLGCTEEQMQADSTLVEQTLVGGSLSTDSSTPCVIFRGTQSASQILRILQVASRGYFYLAPAKSKIWSAWLQPTERWFSLSFYLASRYHVALWEKFTGEKSIRSLSDINQDSRVLQRVIPEAVQKGLAAAFREDRKNLRTIRDGIIWGVMVDRIFPNLGGIEDEQDWDAVWQSLRFIRLRELNGLINDMHALILSEFDKSMAAEMERQLTEEASLKGSSAKVNDGASKKKFKKKRKGGKKHQSLGGSTEPSLETLHNEVTDSEERDDGALHIDYSLIQFPNNGISTVERQHNIIFALTILEEVVEGAFVEAGLQPTPPFVPDPPKEKNNRRDDEILILRPRDWQRHKSSRTPPEPELPRQEMQPMLRGGMFAPSAFSPTSTQLLSSDSWPAQSADSKSRSFPSLLSASSEPTLPDDFHRPIVDDFSAATSADIDKALDGWPFLDRRQAREQSILSHFFQERKDSSQMDEDDDERLMAASTAASVASSTYKDPAVLSEAYEIEKTEPTSQLNPPHLIATIEEMSLGLGEIDDSKEDEDLSAGHVVSDISESPDKAPRDQGNLLAEKQSLMRPQSPEISLHGSLIVPRSPSPQAPSTPPPTLSPILVSLADLRELRRGFSLTPERKNSEAMETRSYSAAVAGSLPGSPTPAKEKGALRASLSRDDLRLHSFHDDQNIVPRRRPPQSQRSSSDLQPSYRAAAIKSLAKPIASSKSIGLDFRTRVLSSVRREGHRDLCARSETALDGHREDPHWQHEFRRSEDLENRSTKDETTTITSALSHNREPEEIATLRDERNTYRDMCLTLGAEVAKLKAILAAQQATAIGPTSFEFGPTFGYPMHPATSVDPFGMQPLFYGMKQGRSLGPMSDAGVARGGDHESQVSEDENHESIHKTRKELLRHMPSGSTIVGSDASIEFNNSTSALQNSGPTNHIPVYDAMPMHSLQSRLTKDMLRFLDAMNAQLRRQDKRRQVAVERFSRLVKTIWPRAQVKLYGSHVSGLCLPSSDLDFVVCLPAVHKNAPALAPGVLEGRNAIKESAQRVLARELKGESWVDPRSIKLIERTVVPVIKLSTKDTRARVVQLDISFDSAEHHGLDANEMVAEILEELPLIRPLMLILKQFLMDRGLLTAYTGGISSYCLFLMVARYLQEQPQSINDCGSLLMGFLDFYGNYFDPRATGISVRTRRYFLRPNDDHIGAYPIQSQPQMWNPPVPALSPQHTTIPSPMYTGSRDFRRRNSFSSESGSVDDGRRSKSRPPRFQKSASSRFKQHSSNGVEGNQHLENGNPGHGRPFTFDPLFVEDPLSSGNNVGRNAFRIFQVQRVFSDAHRALVASLEWDIHSAELNDGFESYPLLKCLLQNEDTLYEL